MFFAQGRDFPGQRPDETNTVRRRAGNEVVVPLIRHSVYGSVLPVHGLKVSFLPKGINRIIAPNESFSDVTQKYLHFSKVSFTGILLTYISDIINSIMFYQSKSKHLIIGVLTPFISHPDLSG